MPAPQDLHIDRYLTDVALDFVQDSSNFVSDKVFPVVPVQKQSDKFVTFERESFWREGQVEVRPLGGRAKAVEWTKGEGTYHAEERTLAHRIDDRERANTDDPIRQDRNATKLLQEQVAIDNDRRWASAYFTDGVWSTEEDGVASSPSANEFTQFDQSGSDPVGTVKRLRRDMRRITARNPNRMVVGSKCNDDLEEHGDVLDRIKYTQRGVVTSDLLAQLFKVDQYLIADAVSNTANEGQSASYDFILDDTSALLAFAPDAPGIETPSAGYTFAWTALRDGAANLMGTAIMRAREELAHSDFFEIASATDINLVSADLGVFLHDAVATT